MGNKLRIGILTFPMSISGITPLSNLIQILQSISSDIYLVTGNEGFSFFKDNHCIHTYGITHTSGKSLLSRVLKYILTQINISLTLIKIMNKVDVWLFFFGGDVLIIPMITLKIFNKKVILSLPDSHVQISKSTSSMFSKPIEWLSKINYYLSDYMIVYSYGLVREWNLDKFKNKIYIAPEHYIDLTHFTITKSYDRRENIIGYIGRFNSEKGIINFVRSIPEVLEKCPDLKFFVAGDGELRHEVEDFINENNLGSKVELPGWIPHDKLPEYLNNLKLLVLPSYSEGLPNIVLEAMACGTPVLATPVGAIPDIIQDHRTGFILLNNRPECISQSIAEAMTYDGTDTIIKNAMCLIEANFTYDMAIKRFNKIFTDLSLH